MTSPSNPFALAIDYSNDIIDLTREPSSRGDFCRFYEAKVYPDRRVTIKKVTVHQSFRSSRRKVTEDEYELWSKISHPNILKLKGICYINTDNKTPRFVFDFQEKGYITDYIRCQPRADILKLIEGVASGLQYLHAIDIVSADIVASKILVGDNDTSLISDFTITANKSLAWKVRWLPPEFIYNDCAALYDPSVDIWMFGLFVQEVLTDSMPFHEETNNKIITLQLSMGKVPEFPKVQHDSWANIEGPLRKLGQSCVIVNQSNRPSIQEIIEQLRILRDTFIIESPERPEVASRKRTFYDHISALSTTFGFDRLTGGLSLRAGNDFQEAEETDRSKRIRFSQYMPYHDESRSYGEELFSEGPKEEKIERNDNIVSGTSVFEEKYPISLPTSLSVEFNNLMARKGQNYTIECSSSQDGLGWNAICKFDGNEVSRASGSTKNEARNAAAKAILFNPNLDITKDMFSSSSSSSGSTGTRNIDLKGMELKESFTREGPPHELVWTCTIYNGDEIIATARGPKKAIARQAARLVLLKMQEEN